MKPVIALDGPAGSGKSTVAKILADELNYIHADSGAIYRTVTLALINKLGAKESDEAFGAALKNSPVDFNSLGCSIELVDGKQSNQIDKNDVGNAIRTPEVTVRIKFIADNPAYRTEVNKLLRSFAEKSPLVMDGRDIGTVVFPGASHKFYLDASVQVRAERRFKEWQEQGHKQGKIEDLEREIENRDNQDKAREIGALKQAEDAILIDTSSMEIKVVVSKLKSVLFP